MQKEFEVIFRGDTLAAIRGHATAFLKTTGAQPSEAQPSQPPPRRTRAAAAPAEETLGEETLNDDITETIEEALPAEEGQDFLAEEPKPKTAAGKKPTQSDVNNAAMKHATKHGRPATLKVLQGSFKVKSIIEMKPEHYAAAIKALAV